MSSVAIASLLSRLVMIFLQAGLGRFGGQAGLGGYATAMAISVYFVFLVDCGLAPRLVREGAVAPDTIGEEYARAMGLKLFSAAACVLLLIILYFVLPYAAWVRELCFWLALGAIVRSFAYLNEAVFRARERLDLEGALQLLHAVLYVGPAFAFLLLGYPIQVVGIAALFASLLQWLISVLWARRFTVLSLRWPPHFATLYRALPYASTSLAVTAFAQVDILILSLITTQDIVGSYTAVSRLLLVVGTMSGIAVAAVLPAAARAYVTTTRDQYQKMVNEALRFTVYLGGLAMLGAVCVAPYIVGLIYGSEFQGLYPLLQLGAAYLVIRFLNSILEALLTSCGRQGGRARAIGIGFLATVVLVLGLVPFFGILGAVLAMILSEAVLLFCLGFFMRDFLFGGLLRRTGLFCLGAICGSVVVYFALMQGPLSLVRSVLSAVAAFAVYFAAFVLSGEAKRIVRFLGIARTPSQG